MTLAAYARTSQIEAFVKDFCQRYRTGHLDKQVVKVVGVAGAFERI